MKIFSKKWGMALVTVAGVAAAGFVLEHFMGFNPVTTAVNTVASPIKNGFSYIAHSLENGRDFIWEMRAYKADNEKLEAENIELKRQSRDIAAYREENKRLEALLDLQNSMSDNTTVAARIIAYSNESWFEAVEINKGTLHGIAKGNVVITPDGVVGRVTDVGPDYAMVTTILDSSSAVGIKVSRTGGSGIIEGDAELAKDTQCKLSFVDRNTPIIVGDVVETSGTGGIYPAGLVVGSVMSISADSTGSLNYAVIDPAVEIDKLSEVLVITG
ncbi:MAG: rod shape-determining protein MreC [Oscillospiraceae bacterium]|nr:rod shape-determining protein MreC [Oscillospiraceae bacterium]